MKKLSESKLNFMNQLSTKDGIIAALAIDQRGALRKMLASEGFEGDTEQAIVEFKKLVSEELTPYSSSILLDPEYGLPASKVKVADSGLLLAYEQTGYDVTEEGRFPDLIHDYSALRLKEAGADAVKFLLYYDIDESAEINERKHAFVERIGSECMAEEIPFYLELLSYDAKNADNGSKEFAKVKPHKVNDMMVEFSKERYHVDVLKMEVPVNMNYVEGFAKSADDVVYTKEEAMKHFKDQSKKTDLPFIFLSAGVSAKLFQDTLYFAKEAGSDFNGVLCGRATWKDGVSVFVKEGEAATREWLRTTGKQNMDDLNNALADTATSWHKNLTKKVSERVILTVTMNPSVDISYPLDNFFIDQVNRCQETKKTAGGKGLNVTRVIHQMERPVVATGFLGGALGTFIEEQLESQKIVHHFSKIEGDTRNCIAVLHDGGKQTEISEAGPTVSKDELDRFEAIFTEEGKNAKVVTISGSLPKGAPSSYYVNLLEDLKETDTRVILDTSGQSLKDVLNSEVKPFAIKPNLEELEGLTGTKIELDEKQLTTVLSSSLFERVELILVSLGKEGAFVKYGKDFYRVGIPKINVINPVGSGDSTVAGLAIALSEEASIEDTLKTAMTLGMLNTMESQTGFVNTTNFKVYFDQVEVLKVDL